MSQVAKDTQQKMLAIAKRHDKQIIELDLQAEQAPMKRGWIAVDMEVGNEFKLLGFEDEKEYWKARGISRSGWFNYKRIAGGFKKKLKLEEFLELAPGKAGLLVSYLSEEERIKDQWLRKAAKKNTRITEDDLKAELERLNPKDRGKENDDDLRQTWKVRGYQPQLAMIDDTIRMFAQQHQLDADDKARVLELICTEVRHGESILAVIKNTVPELRAFLALVNDSSKSAEDTLDEVMKRVTDLVMKLGKSAGLKLQQPDPKTLAAVAGPTLMKQ